VEKSLEGGREERITMRKNEEVKHHYNTTSFVRKDAKFLKF
jgi:hypothetical protein